MEMSTTRVEIVVVVMMQICQRNMNPSSLLSKRSASELKNANMEPDQPKKRRSSRRRTPVVKPFFVPERTSRLVEAKSSRSSSQNSLPNHQHCWRLCKRLPSAQQARLPYSRQTSQQLHPPREHLVVHSVVAQTLKVWYPLQRPQYE